MKPYVIFWQLFPIALGVAEATHPGANLYMKAIQRLKVIEEGKPSENGTPGGETGYLNNNDPYKALEDYIGFIYDGKQIPYWLWSAERG